MCKITKGMSRNTRVISPKKISSIKRSNPIAKLPGFGVVCQQKLVNERFVKDFAQSSQVAGVLFVGHLN